MLLKTACQINSVLDVFLLCGLVSPHQEKQEPITSLRVVDALTRAKVDFEFRDAIRQVAMTAGIAMDKAIYPNLHPCSTCAVLQRIDPFAIDLGLLNTHFVNVADGLH